MLSWFMDLKIKIKIGLANSLMVLLLIFVGIVGLIYIDKVNDNLNYLTDEVTPTMQLAADLEVILWETASNAKDIVISEDLGVVRQLNAQIDEQEKRFSDGYKELEDIIDDDNLNDELANSKSAFLKAVDINNNMVDSHIEELEKELNVVRMMQSFEDIATSLDDALTEFADESESDFVRSREFDDYAAVEASLKLIESVKDALESAREYLSLEEIDQLPPVLAEFEAIIEDSAVYKKQLSDNADNDEERRAVESILTLLKSFEESILDEDELFDEYREQLDAEYLTKQYAEEFEAEINTGGDALDALGDYAQSISDNADEKAASDVAQAITLIVMVVVLACIAAAALAIFLGRSITKPLKQGVAMAEALANGDLTHTLSLSQKDEVGLLVNALNAMSEALSNIITSVQKSTELVSSASHELVAVSEQTGQNVQKQYEMIDQTTILMEEMQQTSTDMTQRTLEASESADSVSGLVDLSDQKAENAASGVTQLTTNLGNVSTVIDKLNDSVVSITNILDVIKGIADQTNLLALNAAIEAARAGEQGRGFAVVADEVRSLAQNTQNSTTEIEHMIVKVLEDAKASVASIRSGQSQAEEIVSQTTEVKEALSDIKSAIHNITRMTSQIAAASEQQSVTAAGVSQTALDIKEQAEQTGSGSNQISISAEELSKLATQLNDEVSQFKMY